MTQEDVLNFLEQRGGLWSPRDISTCINIGYGSVCRCCVKMFYTGFVVRTLSPKGYGYVYGVHRMED